MANRTLPGDLSVWRGRWLLLRHSGLRADPTGGGLRRPDPTRHTVAVIPERHGELYALVRSAAQAASAVLPARVALGGSATVELAGDTLVVGLPLVWALPAAQLRAVLVHELALPATHHPRLVRRLLALRRAATTPVTTSTRTLFDAVEQARDAAAVASFGGGLSAVEDAAAALLRAASVADDFDFFAYTLSRSFGISDLHAGWRMRLDRTVLDTADERVADEHPGLAAELRQLTGQPQPADPPAGSVPLDPLSPAEHRMLAAGVLGRRAEWRSFAEVPAQTSLAAAELAVKRCLAVARQVLGRPPANADELADALAARRTSLVPAVEYALLQRGWRRDHPAVDGVLTDPDGRPVDLHKLADQPDELRRLLNAPGAPAGSAGTATP